jgi:mono/diheme cytochrome c family protein
LQSTHRRRLVGFGAALAAVPLLLTPLASGASSASSASSAKTVRVTLKDGGIALSSKTAPAGSVTFQVKNAGKKKHDFKIAAKKTPVLAPGKSARLVVNFVKAGKFTYTSTVAGDAKKGLKGVFTTTKKPVTATASVAAGRQVFSITGCGGCHVLQDAKSSGTVGPNLDASVMTKAGIVSIVTKGKGSMLSYRDTLTAKEISDVADYIVAVRGP